MKWYWKLFYSVQEWQCRRFGHKRYFEGACVPPGWACKRGYGPV